MTEKSASKTVSLKLPRGTDPAQVAQAFEGFGAPVRRVLIESRTTNVGWEASGRSSVDPTYPEVAVEIMHCLPVEVAVIGSFSPGEGERFYRSSTQLQKAHQTFVDEYNEASAKICNADFDRSDPTTVYTFSVGTEDLVFHRHEGHRAITGVTGAAGACLKFSAATANEAATSPEIFVDKMFMIEVPPDSLFILRFHGTTYHQFGSRDPSKPAFFAISVHTNEAGGLDGDLLEIVKAGNASIPLLTEPITDNVAELLDKKDFKKMNVKKNRERRTISATKRYMLRLRQETDGASADSSSHGAAAPAAESSGTTTTSGDNHNTPHSSGSPTVGRKNTLGHGNHVLPPQAISDPIADLLASDPSWKTRVPVFSLPRLVTSYVEPQETYLVEFDGPKSREAAQAALTATNVNVLGVGTFTVAQATDITA
eukprot:TRINITY_DN618_c0_g1_i1.p1 TRINITY_DN618_c0_g1~~TRINITY_DN618_c0_g1_i1.p1  ORF type:complete len:457 (+),score=93.16 TRINITY_DN618_c0_g1_i1:94-1371(+)